MLGEFILELAGEIFEELMLSPRIPKIIRMIMASVIFIPLTATALMLVGSVESIAGKIIIGAVAAVILLLYLALLRKIIRS